MGDTGVKITNLCQADNCQTRIVLGLSWLKLICNTSRDESRRQTHSVQSTLCEMRSMSPLGGSGGMPPQEILKKLPPEFKFGGNFDRKLAHKS